MKPFPVPRVDMGELQSSSLVYALCTALTCQLVSVTKIRDKNNLEKENFIWGS